MKIKVLLLAACISSVLFAQGTAGKFTNELVTRFAKTEGNAQIAAWVFFTDKGNEAQKWKNNPTLFLTQKSIQRREMRRLTESLLDETDFPLAAGYVEAVEQYGAVVRQKSKWFNGVSINATREQLLKIAELPFVQSLDIVYQLKKEKPLPKPAAPAYVPLQTENTYAYDYGASLTQMQQIKVPDVHNLGILGQGVVVCLMDAGFNNLPHEAFSQMQIIATYDFVNHRIGVGDSTGLQGEGSHGTETLSTIGGYKPGQLIGPAFKAKYILTKTENTDSETPIEEDNWIAAAEFADSIGVDVTSTSLGYITFDSPYTSYTWQSMDGNTCRITRAADLATNKGIVVVNSAGNEGSNSSHNTLGAPADGKRVIAVGAVTSSGTRSSFSSVGNTVDNRVKPDVMAMGSSVRVASPYSATGYTYSDGTSFSGPLAGGVAALVLCARPFLTPLQVRDAMRNTASRASNPDREYGWGILNALNAINYFPAVASPTPVYPIDYTTVAPVGSVVKWSKITGATKYKVQVSSSINFATFVVNDSTVTDTMKNLPALTPGTIYYWRVQAKTADGSSAFSGTATFQTSAVQITWQNTLTVNDNGNQSQVLKFGMSPTATDSIDTILGELTLPPVPPAGVFSAVFMLSTIWLDYTYSDFRSDTNRTVQWLVRFQPGSAGYPITFNWSNANLPAGTFTLKDWVTGTVVNVNMKNQNSYVLTETALDRLIIEYKKESCKDVAVNTGWNLVSVPVQPATLRFSSLFPAANSSAYGYNNGYTIVDTLVNGKGYWMRFPQAATTSICGLSFGSSVAVSSGWNLVGVNDVDAVVSQITTVPAGIINSQFYGYNSGYSVPTVLTPGKGYWVRTTQAGTLKFNQSAAKNPEIQTYSPSASAIKLNLRDNAGNSSTLYYGDNAAGNLTALPPVPPAGIFDARFASNSMAANAGNKAVIQIQAEQYPVSLAVEGGMVSITDLATGGKLLNTTVQNGAAIQITNPSITAIEVLGEQTPGEFALFKNYPNPFNPSTNIRFSLAAPGKVTLTVYDVLGNTVAVLVNGQMEAGAHTVAFNAANMASGLYIYELRSGTKTLQNKMLLLK